MDPGAGGAELALAVAVAAGSATIFSCSKFWKVRPSSCPSSINWPSRIASSSATETRWPACGLVAGFVRRERDDNDRRKVFIALIPENIAKVGKCYEPVQQAMLKL
ncbi:hypothetical protein [Bradyrhizobium canariense]|uniref:hypothetical protein n=1 Tax=Bradyrhizobium canariense TaxID=255045 RepID=UPI00157D2B46